MSKLHYCLNGRSVTEQVLLYQKTRSSDDYLPVQFYYDDYKEQWYAQLEDYMDRATFDSEFDFKLCKAADSFNGTQAASLAQKNGWSAIGAFNRWFYKILSNWKSNVKTSSFRLKKRPAIQCPICARYVGRIDMDHLKHYKSISDLPKYFIWKGDIYETSVTPRVHAVTWGEKSAAKWKALQSGDTKSFATSRKRIPWPWFHESRRAVVCPFTRKIVSIIDELYIQTLPDKYSRYAQPMSWENFIERYPAALIQSEIYRLDYSGGEDDDDVFLKDDVAKDMRMPKSFHAMDYEQICKGKTDMHFENSFFAIDSCINDQTDRDILKLLAAGYVVEDIASTLDIDRKEVRKRMRNARENHDLENLLKR